MRIALCAVVFCTVALAVLAAPAQAAGWPGTTSSYSLRADVPSGVTLKRLWSRINGR